MSCVVLSPADLAIVERDPALPCLALVLDAEALAARLGVDRLRSSYLRYKPGTSCVAGFLDGWRSGPFAAIAYDRARLEQVGQRAEWNKGPFPAEFLADVAVALVPLALDRGLKAARRLSEPEQRAKLLGRLLGKKRTENGPDLTVLRYKPSRRLVLRADEAGRPIGLIKAYAQSEFASALMGATAAAALGGAPLLGVDLDRHALAIGWIEGRSLCASTGERPASEDLQLTGGRLAELHRRSFRVPSRELAKQDAKDLRNGLAALQALHPGLAQRAGSLVNSAVEALQNDNVLPRLIHGDFSADQVILGPDGPVLIDWDSVSSGAPARDLGSFFARLDAQAVDGVLSQAEADAAQAGLLEGYLARAKAAPEGVRTQHIRAVLALLTEGFRQRQPDWPERTARLLDRAQEIICSSNGVRSPRDLNMPLLETALDPKAMQVRLAALGLKAERLDRAELIRHKPGRRALIRYNLTDGARSRSMIGKMKARRPDVRTPALHDALRAGGLDGRGPHRVGVPRSYGRIDDLSLWLQEAVPGRPLTDLLSPSSSTGASRRAGAALAHLHRTSVETSRCWTMDDEVGVLDRALDAARAIMPDAAQDIDSVMAGARALASRLGAVETCCIHRDFYSDQVLVDGEDVWLVDLDLCAEGDPAIDLGNHLAHIAELALRRYGCENALTAHEVAFLAGYRSAAQPPDADRVAAMRLLSLSRHICISTVFADRAHTTASLVRTCREQFDRLGEAGY
jgi:aminoglycoside phosphotransferase (APT) family kinase protein